MKRSEFILRLAIESKMAVISDYNDFSLKFPRDIDSKTTRECFTSNEICNIPNEIPCNEKEANSLSEENSSFGQSEGNEHTEDIFSEQVSSSLPVANSIEYKRTSSSLSSKSSIISGSESDNNCNPLSDIIKELNLDTNSEKQQKLTGIKYEDYSITLSENKENVRDLSNISLPNDYFTETSEKIYCELKAATANTVGSNYELYPTSNFFDLEQNVHYGHEDFGTSTSEYLHSELSLSSSCVSSGNFEKFAETEQTSKNFIKEIESMLEFPKNVGQKENCVSAVSKKKKCTFILKGNGQVKSPLHEANTRKFSYTNVEPSYEETHQQRYIKKPSARERPTICPLCYKDVTTHFPRHLFRHHKNNDQVKRIEKLKPGSKERLAMLDALRKQGYFHLKVEKNILNPTRTSKNLNIDYFVCSHCLGHFSKKYLFKHMKLCKQKPENFSESGRKCLSDSQTFFALETSKNHKFLNSTRITDEVFGIMRADDISMIAKTDPLICLYGEYLLVKHKRQQMAVVVSNKIREMARMLKQIRATDKEVKGFFDLLKPEMFCKLIYAAKVIAGYEINDKSFKAPSLALHMGTNLKQICDVAFKTVLENRNIPNISWNDREQKKTEINDLKKLIEGHWCNELSSLALKTLQEKRWKKPSQLPIAEDILIFQNYLNDLAESAYKNLTEKIDLGKNYKILTECVLALTVMFNRKRIGEVQYLTIATYNNDFSNVKQSAFSECLTDVEKILGKQFKRVVTGGKGSKPVPILFSKRIQKYIACLMKVRNTTDLIPNTNPYLFANPGSNDKWIAGANIMRRLAKSSGALEPTLLTSTRFRKHIATTLQLMTMKAEEIEQIATFMGHTQKTHAEFYRLPQDIYQTAKVAKVLLLLEKGKGDRFKGKNLNDIEIEEGLFYSSDSELDEEEESTHPGFITPHSSEEIGRNKRKRKLHLNEFGRIPNSNLVEEITSTKKINTKKNSGRIRWSDQEKKLVLDYFKEHIQNKITPKKHECEEFIKKNETKLLNKDWGRIKIFVYNTFRQK